MAQKSVYLVIRVQVEGPDDVLDHAAGIVGNDSDYRVSLAPDEEIRVADTEVIGCLDECPAELD